MKKLFLIFLLNWYSHLGVCQEITLNSAPYQTRDFSYLLGKLPGLSDELLSLHFKLYEGYVKNTNRLRMDINRLLSQGEDQSLSYMALKRRMGWEYDGMLLHELYFENLGGKKPLEPSSLLYKKIIENFGSYEKWKKDFISTGLIRGIGWVILYQEPKEGRLINAWINEHDLGHLAGGTPILVMDVWEHAYMVQYKLDREKYIHAFFQNIQWEIVENRLKK